MEGYSGHDGDDDHDDDDAEEPNDDDQPKDQDVVVAVTATKIPCYELCYSKAGKYIKVKMYDEMHEVDGMKFVELNPQKQGMSRWLLDCTQLRKMKHRNDRCFDVIGINKLKELRNLQTIQQQTGAQSGQTRPVARPSMFVLKKMELQGKLSARNAVVEIQADDSVLRVLSRKKKDYEVLWVCSEDLVPCINFIKNQGLCKAQLEDLPVGICKRQRKGSTTYEIRKKSEHDDKMKYISAKSLEEAIGLQQQL